MRDGSGGLQSTETEMETGCRGGGGGGGKDRFRCIMLNSPGRSETNAQIESNLSDIRKDGVCLSSK